MNPLSMPPAIPSVRFGGKSGRRDGHPQSVGEKARDMQDTLALHKDYKANRRWEKLGALSAVLMAVLFGINAVEAVQGKNDFHIGGVEGASNAADMAGSAILGLGAASCVRGSRRDSDAARRRLNDKGYVVVGRRMVPVERRPFSEGQVPNAPGEAALRANQAEPSADQGGAGAAASERPDSSFKRLL